MDNLNLFKLEYRWYEGEFESIILTTTKEEKEIEKDLKEITRNVKIDDEKEVDCLPTAYRKIITELEKRGYSICYFITNPVYSVEDEQFMKGKKSVNKYRIHHKEEKIKWAKI